VSELVTNAVLHARSSAEVTMRLGKGELWVGVSDESTGAAARKRYGPDAETGRGLLLVERIATAWGSEPSGAGKLVWFQLAPGTGETAMAGAEADFAADLAELAGDRAAGGSAPPPRPRGTQAHKIEVAGPEARHDSRRPRATRGPAGRRAPERTVERKHG